LNLQRKYRYQSTIKKKNEKQKTQDNADSHPLKKRPHTIIKMNDNINMDSTIAGLMTARS